jgi:hypothetical protein
MHVFQIADSNQRGPPLTPGALHNDQRRLNVRHLRPNLDFCCERRCEVGGCRSHKTS